MVYLENPLSSILTFDLNRPTLPAASGFLFDRGDGCRGPYIQLQGVSIGLEPISQFQCRSVDRPRRWEPEIGRSHGEECLWSKYALTASRACGHTLQYDQRKVQVQENQVCRLTNWVMQAERGVALPPIVSYSLVSLNDERIHSQHLESCGNL